MPVMPRHSKSNKVVSTVLKKLSTWFLDGPNIRVFYPYHMELIEHNVEDLEERKTFAKVCKGLVTFLFWFIVILDTLGMGDWS